MNTTLVQGYYYKVFDSNGRVEHESVQYTGRETEHTFIFTVLLEPNNGQYIVPEIQISKHFDYRFEIAN